jgi:hypothetical protein
MSDSEDQLRSDFMKKVLAASGKSDRVPVEIQEQPQNEKTKAKSDTKKKALTVWLNPAAIKQFKSLAVELGMTDETAIAEAMNLLFKKYREPEIA